MNILRDVISTNLRKLLPVIFGSLLMILLSYYLSTKIVEKHIAASAEEALNTAEATISAHIRELSLLLSAVSISVKDMLEANESLDNINTYFNDIYAMNATENEYLAGKFFLYGYLNGAFISGGAWEPPADFIAEKRPWFEAAKKSSAKITMTSPYVDLRTGKTILSLIKNMGGAHNADNMVGIDLDFESLSDYVKNVKLFAGGYGQLIASDFTLLTYFDATYVGNHMGAISPEHESIARELKAGTVKIFNREVTNPSGTVMITFYKKMDNGWYVGISNPKSEYFNDVYVMAFLMSTIGFILLASTCYSIIILSIGKITSDEESKSKVSFLARMSHEIRTPLNSIIGMTELITRKNIATDVREYITIANQSSVSLLAIINDILDFSKIESGQFFLETKTYTFSSILNDILNVVRVRLIDSPLTFIIHIDPHIPARLIGDNTRVRQVLLNLLSNAIKFTHSGFVSLDIKVRKKEPDSVTLSCRVKDTGIGIKHNDIKKLFIDFSRVDLAHNQKIEGTGLGLAITNFLCQEMQGNIAVKSEYGNGSTFTATIVQGCEDATEKCAYVNEPEKIHILLYEENPLMESSLLLALHDMRLPKPTVASSLGEFLHLLGTGRYGYAFISSKYVTDCLAALEQKVIDTELVIMVGLGEIDTFASGVSSIMLPTYSLTIANILNGTRDDPTRCVDMAYSRFSAPAARALVVDDIATNLRVAKEFIAYFDIQIDTCTCGADAVDFAKKHRYDIVFMDHMMPGMDGVEAAARIRKLGETDESLRDLPIIALTANAMVGQREMFLENGFNGFLAKPVDMQRLHAILKKWIPAEKQIAVATSPAIENASTLEPLEIDGIDVVRGIKNSGGTIVTYKNILRDFCSDSKMLTAKLEQMLLADNLYEYQIAAHSLKGSLRLIGAEKLSTSAEKLESAAISQDTFLLHEETDNFIQYLYNLINLINNFIGDLHNTEQKTVDKNPIHNLDFSILKNSLLSMDVETINILLAEYADMNLVGDQQKIVNDIEQSIINFDYGNAIYLISEYERLQEEPAVVYLP